MRSRRDSETGQAAVLLALAFVGLLAFTALAIDGGNAYLTRRNAQNAADSAALGGTRAIQRLLYPMPGDLPVASPDTYLRVLINDAAQRNGVADTNDDPQDDINTYVEAYYVNASGDRVSDLQVGMQGYPHSIPEGTRGVEAMVDIPFDSFIAGIIGRPTMQASASAGSIFNLSHTSVGGAIWANALNCDPNTLKLTGEQQIVNGTVHSNGNLHIAGNTSKPSYFTGTLEYAPDSESFLNVVGANIFDPPDNAPVPTTPEDKADLFDIEDFAEYGVEAAEARARGEYHYLGQGMIVNKTLENAGLLQDGVLAPGLYFTNGSFSLSESLTAVDVTLVARGDIKFSGSNHHFVHYEPQLLFFANGDGEPKCNHKAIQTSSSMNTWYGFIYAPNGGVVMSHADNSALYGIIFAHTIDISGSDFQFNYDVAVDPLRPPTIVLVW
jgi:hypothetical protein